MGMQVEEEFHLQQQRRGQSSSVHHSFWKCPLSRLPRFYFPRCPRKMVKRLSMSRLVRRQRLGRQGIVVRTNVEMNKQVNIFFFIFPSFLLIRDTSPYFLSIAVRNREVSLIDSPISPIRKFLHTLSKIGLFPVLSSCRPPMSYLLLLL